MNEPMNDKPKIKPDIKPWERQTGEDAKWFARFDTYYRPVGPERSIERAYRAWVAAEENRRQIEANRAGNPYEPKRRAAKATSSWYRNSQEYNWGLRAEAWDEQQRQERLAKEEKDRIAMLERHTNIATNLQGAAAKALSFMLKNENEALLAELTPAEIRQWFALAIRIEREARGLPGEVTEQQLAGAAGGPVLFANIDLTNMDEDDLDAEIERLQRLTERKPTAAGQAAAAAGIETAAPAANGRAKGDSSNGK